MVMSPIEAGNVALRRIPGTERTGVPPAPALDDIEAVLSLASSAIELHTLVLLR